MRKILSQLIMESKAINGLILAGGKSSRMGRDKGLISYHGKPQREYLFEILKEYCKDVYVSCKKDHDIPERLNPLPDEFVMDSPLNGIMTAFKKEPGCPWLVVAVDMPYVDRQAVQRLISQRDERCVATCFRDSDGTLPEPLFSLWEPESHDLVVDFYKKGNISPREFLIRYEAHVIQPRDEKVLRNINTPEELDRFNTEQNDQL